MIHNSTDECSELQAKLAQAEFAVQRAEELALAGRFAAAAVHDINNPLEAISNLTYLLRTEPLSEASAKYLDVMEEQLDRARAVTQQILKLHRRVAAFANVLMPSSLAFPPVEYCRGTRPSHAAKSRPFRKAAPLPMAATMVHQSTPCVPARARPDFRKDSSQAAGCIARDS